jgi:hypothetical protein
MLHLDRGACMCVLCRAVAAGESVEVTVATPKTSTTSAPPPPPARGGVDIVDRVIVKGLGETVSEDALRRFLTPYGDVSDVYFPKHVESGRLKGFAFVQFSGLGFDPRQVRTLRGCEQPRSLVCCVLRSPRSALALCFCSWRDHTPSRV